MGLLEGSKAREESKKRFMQLLNCCRDTDDGTLSRNLKKAKFNIYCKPKIPTVKRPPRGKCGNVPEWVPTPINCDMSLTAEEKEEVHNRPEYYIVDNCLKCDRNKPLTAGPIEIKNEGKDNYAPAKHQPEKHFGSSPDPGPSKRHSSTYNEQGSCDPCGSSGPVTRSRSRRSKSRNSSTTARSCGQSQSCTRSCSAVSEASAKSSEGRCPKRRSRKQSSSCCASASRNGSHSRSCSKKRSTSGSCGPARRSVPRKCKSRAKSAPSTDCPTTCSPMRPKSSKSCGKTKKRRSSRRSKGRSVSVSFDNIVEELASILKSTSTDSNCGRKCPSVSPKRCSRGRAKKRSSCSKRKKQPSVSTCEPKKRRARRSKSSCGSKPAKRRRSKPRANDACGPRPAPKRSKSRKRCATPRKRKCG